MKKPMEQKEIEALAIKKANMSMEFLRIYGYQPQDIKREIQELHRVRITLSDTLKHPWRYLFWFLKQRVKVQKIKLVWWLFPNRTYER